MESRRECLEIRYRAFQINRRANLALVACATTSGLQAFQLLNQSSSITVVASNLVSCERDGLSAFTSYSDGL